jgi:hypothetical protein
VAAERATRIVDARRDVVCRTVRSVGKGMALVAGCRLARCSTGVSLYCGTDTGFEVDVECVRQEKDAKPNIDDLQTVYTCHIEAGAG